MDVINRPWRRALFVTLGLCSVGLGLLGVVVPGLPTTVFVLLASYFFARSSPRLSTWLEQHRWLGPPLARYRRTGGMDRRTKTVALAAMWTGLAISWFILADVSTMLQVVTVALGLIGTATIVFGVRTVPQAAGSESSSTAR